MAKILTSQSDLDRIFSRMRREYNELSKKQRAYAIREMGRVRADTAELLAEYADKDGEISRRRLSRLLRDMDVIEDELRKNGEQALHKIINDTTEWTTRKISGIPGVKLSANQFDRINRHVVRYVVGRFGDDNLVLSDRIWGLSGEIRDELTSVIRTGIIRGDGVNAMIPRIRQAYNTETWKIERLARTESVTAHRAAVSYNAQASDLVKWVQFNDGTCGRKDHHRHACYALANEDRYGKGRGVYKPNDTDIWLPHPNCTSYITYILDERWL